jgi:hypothetical protein
LLFAQSKQMFLASGANLEYKTSNFPYLIHSVLRRQR